MSYILDALNKSEQERAKKEAPGLSRLRDDEPRQSPGIKPFIIAFIALGLLNALGVYFYFGDRTAPTRPTGAPAEAPVIDTPATRPPPAEPPTLPPQPQPQPQTVSNYARVVPIEQLPAEVRARLPQVEVTAHIYAEDPELRLVMIAGSARSEGDRIGQALRLREITETGLILEFEEYAYILNVIEDWQL